MWKVFGFLKKRRLEALYKCVHTKINQRKTAVIPEKTMIIPRKTTQRKVCVCRTAHTDTHRRRSQRPFPVWAMHNMHKYHAQKAQCRQGHIHDSRAEAARCNELHLLERAGEISDLRIQVKYELIPPRKYADMPGERGCSYAADFDYVENGRHIVEDVKGMRTAEYIIKRKLFKTLYCQDGGMLFREVNT